MELIDIVRAATYLLSAAAFVGLVWLMVKAVHASTVEKRTLRQDRARLAREWAALAEAQRRGMEPEGEAEVRHLRSVRGEDQGMEN